MKTKIGTCDSDTTFKVKRSKSPDYFSWLYWQGKNGQHGHTEMVTYYAYIDDVYRMSPLAGLGWAYRGGRPPAQSLLISF